MSVVRPFLAALRFLTRVPVPDATPLSDSDLGRSPLFYPLVGLIIGLLLVALKGILHGVPDALVAALVLAVWVLLTGGLHLDGLADSADAWVGGLGDRERTLAIMKDPCSGPAGVSALVLILITKFAALQALINEAGAVNLLAAPLLGRTAVLLLLLTTAYVRRGGMGSVPARDLPRRAGALVVAVACVLVPLTLGTVGLWLLAGAGAAFVVLRIAMTRRIGGTSGDTAGALVEVVETAVLATAAVVQIHA